MEFLSDLVEARAAQAPDETAVVTDSVSLSFAEVNRRANQWAKVLRSRGAGPGSVVALALDRSEHLVVLLLAVWKAGAAYVPIDSGYPRERLEYMLVDSGAQLLVHDATAAAAFAGTACPRVVVDDPATAASAAAMSCADPDEADRGPGLGDSDPPT